MGNSKIVNRLFPASHSRGYKTATLETKRRTGARQIKDIHNFKLQFSLFVLSQCDFCFPGAGFSKVPILNFSGPKSYFMFCCFCIHDQSFNNFDNDTMKLSVNEAKLTGLWARNWATIQQVLILKFALGPEKLLGLSRNGPQHGGFILREWLAARAYYIMRMQCIIKKLLKLSSSPRRRGVNSSLRYVPLF